MALLFCRIILIYIYREIIISYFDLGGYITMAREKQSMDGNTAAAHVAPSELVWKNENVVILNLSPRSSSSI